jgi:hypothetical protein
VVLGVGGGGGACDGTVVEEVVVVVVGGTAVEVVVVAPACMRFEAPWNAAAADMDKRDRGPAAWPKFAIWTTTAAEAATSKIGTSPMARPRRARGEGMGESSWVGER